MRKANLNLARKRYQGRTSNLLQFIFGVCFLNGFLKETNSLSTLLLLSKAFFLQDFELGENLFKSAQNRDFCFVRFALFMFLGYAGALVVLVNIRANMSQTKISILAKRSLILDRVATYRNLCTAKSRQTTKEDLETRRREVMGRGLPKQKPIEGVKQILIVASGKGGVGKSTTSVNLAIALKINEPEKEVGLLDADVFGPSVPLMMNLDDSPILNDKNLMVPLVNYGVKCMSMGFLVNKESAMIWRGLMVMNALEKLIRQVAWGPLDYLIIDTPPGTGDTHLSLVQNVPVSGVLLVTTPQKAAIDVTRRGALMYQKLNVPLVGIVENMSSIICPKCNYEASLFRDGSLNLAWELGINILCKIPINDDIAEGCDNGEPILVSKPNSRSTETYKKLAKEVSEFLQEQRINAT